MRLASVATALVLLAVQVVQADEACVVSSVDHERIEERSRVIEFPSGQRFTLLGHEHGDPDELKRLMRWVTNPVSSELLNDKWIAHIDGFLEDNPQAAQHARENLAFLRATYWMSAEPIVVAVEAHPDDVERRIEAGKDVRASLRRQHCERDLGELPALRSAELLLMGAPIYSYLEDPELRERYTLIGVDKSEEGMALQNLGKKTLRVAEARLADVAGKRSLDEAAMQAMMQSVIDEMDAAYADAGEILVYDHNTIRERVEPHLEQDPEMRGAVLSYLFGYLDFLRGMKQRDVAMVDNLLVQDESVVLVVGEEHLPSLMDLLKITCDRRMPTATPQTREPPAPGLLDEILERY